MSPKYNLMQMNNNRAKRERKISDKKSLPAGGTNGEEIRAGLSFDDQLAKDGAKTEGLVLFLCRELVFWLTNQESLLRGHRLADKDALVTSQFSKRPSLLDLKERYLDKGVGAGRKPFDYSIEKNKLPKGKTSEVFTVVVSDSIPTQIFRRKDFYGDNFNHYSYDHFYLLKFMLAAVENHFRIFVSVLNETMEGHHAMTASQGDSIARTSTNLKMILEVLKSQHDGYIGIGIPDLFSNDPDAVLLTCDFDKINKKTIAGKVAKGLYTHMYSLETSQAFSEILFTLLDGKYKNLETELNYLEEQDEVMTLQLNLKQWLAKMPKTDTKERMKLALQILGVRTDEGRSDKGVHLTTGEVMLVFRALESCGVIIPNLDSSKIAVAMEILSGKSHLVYQAKYKLTGEKPKDFKSICEVKEDAAARNSIRKLAKRIQAALDKLIAEVQ